jgi:hypothetical protein
MSELERSVEKNDVDISQLFKWNKKVEIADIISGNKVSFYMRLLGDSDLNVARAHAYRKSAELRRKLKTPDSDSRVLMLAEFSDISDPDVLVPTIEILRTPEIYQRVMRNMDMPEPKEPPKDDLEVWEKYQAEVDEYPKKFREKVEEEAEKIRKADMEELRKRTPEELYKVYENEVIAKLCQEEMNDAFYDMSIYLSTFKDEKFKNRSFKSFEDYDNVHPNFKAKLKEEYQKLELGIDLLKKLPEATE